MTATKRIYPIGVKLRIFVRNKRISILNYDEMCFKTLMELEIEFRNKKSIIHAKNVEICQKDFILNRLKCLGA